MGEGGDGSLGGRLARIRGVLDGVLADNSGTLLDVKRRIASELSIDPKPQAIQALAALRDISDLKGREVGSRAAILHLAVDSSVFELWDALDATPSTRHRGVAMVPPLLALRTSVEKAFDEAIGAVDRAERDLIGKMHAALRLPEEPLHAALAVVPELAALTTAARNGTLAEAAPSLTAEERDAVVATTALGPGEASRADRAFLDAIALRTLIEREVGRFRASAPTAEADAPPKGAGGDSRKVLESLRVAHGVVSPRLDAVRSEQYARTRKGDRRLDQARRTLFAVYLDLSKALAESPTEVADSVRDQILDAEHAGAAVDEAKRTTEGLMRDATAGAAQPVAVAPDVPPDVQDLIRERRRKKILVYVAAALVPVALTANIAFYGGRGGAPLAAAGDLAKAMPVQQLMPIGRALYCQVSALLWEDLTASERGNKVNELGKIAGRQGYQALIVVDENRRERARWSAVGGAEMAKERPSSEPAP